MNIIVSGSLSFDIIMDFPGSFKDHILPEKVHVLSVSFGIDKLIKKKGGVAGNVAYTLNLLEEKPLILGTAGHDFGDYMTYLKELGIETRGIKIIEDDFTACARIITDKDNNQITAFHPGAMGRSGEIKINDFDIDTEKAIVLIGPDSKEGMMNKVVECRDMNIPYIFDPGQSMGLWDGSELKDMLSTAKILIVNDYELEMVQQKTGHTTEGIIEKIETLIVTLGEKGSVIHNKDEKIEIPAVKVEVVDPTGAGDAFRAGLLKGLVDGWDWNKIGRVASLCGAYAVVKHGTQEHSFTMEEFWQRYEKELGG